MSIANETEPVTLIGFTPPDGAKPYAQVAVWARSLVEYKLLRECASKLASFDDTDSFSRKTGVLVHCCHWNEGEVHCSLHLAESDR